MELHEQRPDTSPMETHKEKSNAQPIINVGALKKKLQGLKKQRIMAILLIVVIGVSAYQTYQILQLREIVGGSAIKPVKTQSAAAASSSLPASLENLPDMVGGC